VALRQAFPKERNGNTYTGRRRSSPGSASDWLQHVGSAARGVPEIIATERAQIEVQK